MDEAAPVVLAEGEAAAAGSPLVLPEAAAFEEEAAEETANVAVLIAEVEAAATVGAPFSTVKKVAAIGLPSPVCET